MGAASPPADPSATFSVESISDASGTTYNVKSDGDYVLMTAEDAAAVGFPATPAFAWSNSTNDNRWVIAELNNDGSYTLKFYTTSTVDLLLTSEDTAASPDPLLYTGNYTHETDGATRIVTIVATAGAEDNA